jgi:hypothetical protein
MVDLEVIQSVYYMMAATGVLVAAIYYVMNIRTTQTNLKANLETRQTQLFMQIYMRYLENDLFGENYFKLIKRQWNDPAEYVEKYGIVSPASISPDGGDLNKMMTFLEGVAVLVEKKMIDVDLVYQLMPTNITVFWSKYGPLIKYWRENGPAPPNLYRLVETLSDKITEHAKMRMDPVITTYNRKGASA